MRRASRRCGAQLDGCGGIRSAHEIEPIAEHDRVVNAPHNGGGYDKDACQPECAGPQLAASKQDHADAHPAQQRHHPTVIARKDRSYKHCRDSEQQTSASALIAFRCILWVDARPPLHQPDRYPDHLAQKQRLGHGRALQVEKIGIGREKGECQGRGRWLQPAARQAVDADAAGKVSKGRRNHSRNSIGPPRIHRDEGNHQQMG